MINPNIISLHHLNCCTFMPGTGRLFNGRSPCILVTHCLLIETPGGLVLVDTGLGMADVESPQRSGLMRSLIKPRLNEDETAFRQIEKSGYNPADVHHIIMTHLDFDHAGGLPDFPQAKVHILKPEYEAALQPIHIKEKARYNAAHWKHSPDWVIYEESYDEPWFGFDSIRHLKGLPPDIILVRLPGHTQGHCGIAVNTSKGWLLHAGDIYYFNKQMDNMPLTTP
ncbi:MAG: MBL fold metallo-hydrolase, partial [Dehalococcoidia bacterium]|nr:MBL fold metallo-hydrolase [Dehalococcoidia bacterium]